MEKYLIEKQIYGRVKIKEENLFHNLNELCDEEGPPRLDNKGFHAFIVYSSADVDTIAPGC